MVDNELFVLLGWSSGRQMVGIVVESDVKAWETSGVLHIKNPRDLQMHQVSENAVQVVPMPVFPVKIAQKEMIVKPEILCVISTVEKDARTGAEFCADDSKLYPAYMEAVKAWAAELSNIVLAKASDLPASVLKFPVGR